MIHTPSGLSAPDPSPNPDGHLADPEVQRAGREWISNLYAAFRVLRMYPVENQAVQNALGELVASTERLRANEGQLSVRYAGDLFFINDLRLRVDHSNFATFAGAGQALKQHGVGQLDVFGETGVREWTALLSILLEPPAEPDPFASVEARLARSPVRNVDVRRTSELADASDEERDQARRTYSRSVAAAREAMQSARLGRGVNLRSVKRAVQGIVDQVLNNETSILSMTTLRDYDEYTFTHSVNVCIFSVALGRKIGLAKHELYELGLGALLHDVGKMQMPPEVVNKTSSLSDTEWRIIQEHPTEGLLKLFEMRGFADLPLRAMLMAYEHHMKVDQSGYPRSRRPRAPTLFSRVVAIADGFDAATSTRSYQSQPWTPDQVLQEMRDNPRRGYDPLLVKAFIAMTGAYPVGSVVLLDTHELAVVLARNPRPDAAHQPIVRVIFDPQGMPLQPAPRVDLAETLPETGRPRRVILRSVDAVRHGIDVASYVA